MSKEESKKGSSEGEDIPSDFFDDFNKEDFMDGLSVIDSWNNEEKRRSRGRIDEEAVNSVSDLRELIVNEERNSRRGSRDSPYENKHLDDYIRPGSRRDPSKTQEAIRKDKEVKVKEFLAKHLESSDDLRPPGTELDDYFDESISEKRKLEEKFEMKKRIKEQHDSNEDFHSDIKEQHDFDEDKHRSMKGRHEFDNDRHRGFRERPDFHESKNRFSYRDQGDYPFKHRRESPRFRREPPFRTTFDSSQNRQFRQSPFRYRRLSPSKRRYDARFRGQEPHNPRHRSPRLSPRRPAHAPQWSPRHSPQRMRRNRSPEPRRERRSRSRSPYKRTYTSTRSRTRSRSTSKSRVQKDDFLYPDKYSKPSTDLPLPLEPQYVPPVSNEYGGPSYQYPQVPAYTGYNEQYYPPQPNPQLLPQPIPNQNILAPLNTPMAPTMNPAMVPAPCMVPAPSQPTPSIPINPIASQILETTPASPYDALAKLVADGKLSHEDYLKLAPNKGVTQNMDPKARVSVLNRCNVALSHLGNLTLPNRLLIHNLYIGQEQKSIAPMFGSPLKRQSAMEFYFSKTEKSIVAQRNKQIIESIICALSLDKVVSRPKKKVQKDVKEASVQTFKPVCEVCEIRETVKFCDASTSTDPEYFRSSVHTQVIEEDLYSSKSVFNPSGSGSSSAPISIAHLTPAQLVSQLAARAKTLKQPEPLHPNPRGLSRKHQQVC
ncbi:unnamed protein product [Colias eurytheme]|nr:unnamed protein product [Colias eurytheme]